jgi:hypothetical protein
MFLLLAQVAMEQATFRSSFHSYPRILVCLGFSVYRQQTLFTWARLASQADLNDSWALSGLALAVSGCILYGYNLFFFLLMRVVPHYLDPAECPDPEVEWAFYLVPLISKRNSRKST